MGLSLGEVLQKAIDNDLKREKARVEGDRAALELARVQRRAAGKLNASDLQKWADGEEDADKKIEETKPQPKEKTSAGKPTGKFPFPPSRKA